MELIRGRSRISQYYRNIDIPRFLHFDEVLRLGGKKFTTSLIFDETYCVSKISYHTWNCRPNSEGKKPNPAVNDIPPNWAFN